MIAFIGLFAAMLAANGSPALAETQPLPAISGTPSTDSSMLPPFEFRGIVAGEAVDRKSVGLKGCHDVGSKVICMTLGRVAAVPSVVTVTLLDDRLSELKILTGRDAFETILSSFQEKYGQPCYKSTEIWKNSLGAQLDNPTYSWCFRTGVLKLKGIGESLSDMEATYVDTSNADTPHSVVDF